jgi:hypothetical protein
MKRLLLPLWLLFAAGCYAAPVVVAGSEIPPGEAQRIAFHHARSRGYNPVGVRYIRRTSRAWDVLVELGPPACGLDRIHVGRWDGRVYGSHPAVYACGYYYAEPPPPIY